MTAALPFWFDAALFAAMSFALIQLSLIGKCLMATQSDVDKLATQVVKIGQEVADAKDVLVKELNDLKDQLAEANVPAEKVDLTLLAAAIQNLDDIHPDVVLPPEVEGEPEVDEDDDSDVVDEAVEDEPQPE